MNQMTVKDFFKWSEKEYATEMELMRVKGEEYTVSDGLSSKAHGFNTKLYIKWCGSV